MTPAWGEKDSQESLRMIFSLLISTLSPAKPQLWSPRKVVRGPKQVVCEFSPRHFTHPSNQTPFPLQPHFRNFSKEKSPQSHQEMAQTTWLFWSKCPGIDKLPLDQNNLATAVGQQAPNTLPWPLAPGPTKIGGGLNSEAAKLSPRPFSKGM